MCCPFQSLQEPQETSQWQARWCGHPSGIQAIVNEWRLVKGTTEIGTCRSGHRWSGVYGRTLLCYCVAVFNFLFNLTGDQPEMGCYWSRYW